MRASEIKPGHIFHYEDHLPLTGQVHRHRCRVLFVGQEHLFYDVWLGHLAKWSFIPVKKRLSFYRFPLSHIGRLQFDGFQEMDESDAAKLFLDLPEILLRTTMQQMLNGQAGSASVSVHAGCIAYIPLGPKGGTLKPVLITTDALTASTLAGWIVACQSLDHLPSGAVVVHRVGLHAGWPSYGIRTA